MCRSKRKIPIRNLSTKLRHSKADNLINVTKENAKQDVIDLSAVELVKPKKRKRDKLAGLKIKTDTKSIMVSNKVVAKTAAPKAILVSSKPGVVHHAKKQKANATKGKAKGKNVQVKKHYSSETKQRNNILLLANVLKMKDKPANSLTTNLQSLLRK